MRYMPSARAVVQALPGQQAPRVIPACRAQPASRGPKAPGAALPAQQGPPAQLATQDMQVIQVQLVLPEMQELRAQPVLRELPVPQVQAEAPQGLLAQPATQDMQVIQVQPVLPEI